MTTLISKLIGDKRRWRQYKARTSELPASHRAAVDAIERYLMCFGSSDADTSASMLEDLATLFEESAADGTSVRDVVGEDPVEFVETFLQNYPNGQWITKERDRLSAAIDRATGGERS